MEIPSHHDLNSDKGNRGIKPLLQYTKPQSLSLTNGKADDTEVVPPLISSVLRVLVVTLLPRRLQHGQKRRLIENRYPERNGLVVLGTSLFPNYDIMSLLTD